MAISNTDDHFRNHGIVMDENGVRLSPVYDINPSPYGDGLALNITKDDNLIDTDNLFKTYMYYNLGKEEAVGYYNEVVSTVNNNWMRVAKRYGISNASMEMMKSAFSLKEVE